MKKCILSILLLICSTHLPPLSAKESASHGAHLPNVDIDADISAVAAGCVNIISGDYVESSQDLVLLGPEPLIFERSYFSSDNNAPILYDGWRHNHCSQVILEKHISENRDHDDFVHADYLEANGRYTSYKARHQKGLQAVNMKLNWKKSKKGLTNCGLGLLGGCTNLKNIRVHCEFKKDLVKSVDGRGVKRKFEHFCLESDSYSQTLEKRPNGLQLHYAYNDHKGAVLSQVKLTDATGNKSA
jgi:hypothetical protein